MKTKTIMIEDEDRYSYRTRLEEVLNRYSEEDIFNIDTGIGYDGFTDSRGCPIIHYYAIIIVKRGASYEVS